ncbi:chitin deacetylase [Rhodosporidiobolus nylandii]
MKAAVVALLALSSAASARMEAVPAHADLLRRQATAPTSSTTPSSRSRAQHSSTLVVGAPTSVAASATTAAAGAGGHVASSPLASLSKIGTSTTAEATQALPTTYAAGATVPVAGAPNLPSLATLNPASYPPLDHIPPLDSPEMEEWLSEIDWDSVPDIEPTAPGGCANASNADALANAGPDGACWWTCGGCTRATDITYCPTKEDWGASFDDGPSPYTPRLLNLLDQQNLKSTFFIVGSRAISRPEMLQYEYASGHQISIHTWAHSSLTTLSNEEIVAELGWTKKVIKEITGVTPNTMRPPYGDIDDRVRSIALQMGLRPIIWTQADGQQFDTRDWQIGGGVVSAPDVYNNFERFLSSASSHLSTGFIVLAHDLYQQSVDLAVDYILPGVINEGKLKIKTISECLGEPLSQAYIETNDNSTSLLQTTATVVGATGAGFVPGIGR